MTDLWEPTFAKHNTIWGMNSTTSANRACALFTQENAQTVLIPGIGYGRNAKPFLDAGMSVVGIEISKTAIKLAGQSLGLDLLIHHGSVSEMPFDDRVFDGVFCFGLIYLLDSSARQAFLKACASQLKAGGYMVFTVISKGAPMYGKGVKLGEDCYETTPGMKLQFYDEDAIKREFGPYGLVECVAIDEASAGGQPLPFFYVVCRP